MNEIFSNPKIFSSLKEKDARIFNLRKEISRRIRDARNLRIKSVLEIDGDIRDLVNLCPDECLTQANILWHKYTSKIFTIIKFKIYSHLSLGKNHALKSRDIIKSVQLTSNMMG